MVGIGTVLKDRPSLTTRLPGSGGKNPTRIVADSLLRIPLNTPLVTTTKEAPTWVFYTDEADIEKEKQLIERGVRVIRTGSGSRVKLAKAMKHLAENGILSVLLEGRGGINWSMLEASLVGKVVSFIALNYSAARKVSLRFRAGDLNGWLWLLNLKMLQLNSLEKIFALPNIPNIK